MISSIPDGREKPFFSLLWREKSFGRTAGIWMEQIP